jgi:hypothetical protein
MNTDWKTMVRRAKSVLEKHDPSNMTINDDIAAIILAAEKEISALREEVTHLRAELRMHRTFGG